MKMNVCKATVASPKSERKIEGNNIAQKRIVNAQHCLKKQLRGATTNMHIDTEKKPPKKGSNLQMNSNNVGK